MQNTFSLMSQRGQVLVLVVLAIVVLLGFTAIAIDGSMVYSDRRFAQNASDASALAGAAEAALYFENNGVKYWNWNCSSGAIAASISQAAISARQVAVSRAADNGITFDQDITDKNGVNTQCGEDNTSGHVDKYLDIRSLVTFETPTSFAHFIFGGPLRNTVEAVGRVRPRHNLAFGYAIVALNQANCQGQQNGATFHGNSEVHVDGGGVFTNGCLRGNGHPDIFVVNGSTSYVGELSAGNANWDPEPQYVSTIIPPETYYLPAPNCSHPDAHNLNAGALLNTEEPLHGLYCVSGSLHVNGNDSLIGTGVTIYMLNGGITINGNAEVNITAPHPSPDPSPAIPGLVIYVPVNNTNDIQINGNSESYFEGTILAPGSNIDMLGTGEVDAFHTQVIGWNVEVGGNADTFVLYNGDEQYSEPSAIELHQ